VRADLKALRVDRSISRGARLARKESLRLEGRAIEARETPRPAGKTKTKNKPTPCPSLREG